MYATAKHTAVCTQYLNEVFDWLRNTFNRLGMKTIQIFLT